MDDLGRFAETTSYFAADNGVRPLDLLVYGFAQVVQQRSGFAYVHIGTKLLSNRACKNGDLHRMCQTFLPVTATEIQPSQDFDQSRLQPPHPNSHSSPPPPSHT